MFALALPPSGGGNDPLSEDEARKEGGGGGGEEEEEEEEIFPDGDLQGRMPFESRWVLWRRFMKEHASLDAWLRLAEQAIPSSEPAPFTFSAAKEELRTLERLRREAGPRLVQLDGLTRRNRTLTRQFQGAMRARLLAAARDCGRRWDRVGERLEAAARRLQLCVSEWEEFEAERAELALWLADMDISLSQVDHLTGSTCDKLRLLQSFQQQVCVNSSRVNDLLQRGEELIGRSAAPDAQRVESHLLELLRNCNHVYNNIARTHTRLLSMRLVFEDDHFLSAASDSGCPSESVLEEEAGLLSTPRGLMWSPPPPIPEQQGLEWDPSVDVGRSVSRDDADSSYFSASAGQSHGDGAFKRWSFLTSLEFGSSAGQDPEGDPSLEQDWDQDHWITSTPDGGPGGSVGGRVEAWLEVQGPAHSERRTSCSRAVQTDRNQCFLDSHPVDAPDRHLEPTPPSAVQAESTCRQEEEPSASCCASWRPLGLLRLLLPVAVLLLLALWWFSSSPPCRRAVRLPRTFHLALRYVNGPPPT
ncbi:unnamed protein product [Ophioblennius macclurei]